MAKKSKKERSGRGAALTGEHQIAFQQAVTLHKQGDLQAAVQIYQQILQIYPKHADSLHLLGLVTKSFGDTEQAIELIKRAIKLSPNVASYHFNLGVSFQELDLSGEAIAAYRAAISKDSKYLEAYENLGVALHDVDKIDAAINCCEQALRLNSTSEIALKNLGTLFMRQGRTEAALEVFSRALEIDPANADIHNKRGGAFARLLRFREAWTDNAWHRSSEYFLQANNPRPTGLPNIGAGELSHQRVLVSCEEGVGDEIMYASCFSDLIGACKSASVECDPRLVGLFSYSFPGLASVVSRGEYDPIKFDAYIPLGDLPTLFRPDLDSFLASSGGYLLPDPEKSLNWGRELARIDSTLKIGISWRGGAEKRAQMARNIEPMYWRPLSDHKNASFFNLQYRSTEQERRAFEAIFGDRFVTLDQLDAFNDIEGLAALMSGLDLVITSDNVTAHLAGALGVRTWLLLSRGSESRWGDGEAYSHWYSTVRLFRNPSANPKGWVEVVSKISFELSACDPLLEGGIANPKTHDENAIVATVGATTSPVKTALLLNDTSMWYHWGCTGTTLALHEELRATGYNVDAVAIQDISSLASVPDELEQFTSEQSFLAFRRDHSDLVSRIERADCVVINGEGSLHGTSQLAINLLFLAAFAKQHCDISVRIINHSCYPNDSLLDERNALTELYRSVYSALDFVAVREPISAQLMREIGVDAVDSFDCLPLFIDRHFRAGQMAREGKDSPIVLAGSVSWRAGAANGIPDFVRRAASEGHEVEVLVGAAANMAGDDRDFVRWLQQKVGGSFQLVYARTEFDWLQCIANAKLLVSGRFHHSIAAAFTRTPFLVTSSNTPKIEGMLKVLALECAAVPAEKLSEEYLWAQARMVFEDPGQFLISEDVRAATLKLSRENFRKA